jgi:hypothetical protein
VGGLCGLFKSAPLKCISGKPLWTVFGVINYLRHRREAAIHGVSASNRPRTTLN